MSGPLLLFGSFARPQKSVTYCGLFCCAIKTQALNLFGLFDSSHVEREAATHPNGTRAADESLSEKIVVAVIILFVVDAGVPYDKRRA
jgi:hypothetical protein